MPKRKLVRREIEREHVVEVFDDDEQLEPDEQLDADVEDNGEQLDTASDSVETKDDT